jgi:hypothetical protein
MYEGRVLKTLPTYILNQFPFIMTYRSAMGERMKNSYFKAMESFFSRIGVLKKTGVTPRILAAPPRLRKLI